VPDGGTVLVLGLGPIGEMCTRVAQHRGYRVLGVDLVSDRRSCSSREPGFAVAAVERLPPIGHSPAPVAPIGGRCRAARASASS